MNYTWGNFGTWQIHRTLSILRCCSWRGHRGLGHHILGSTAENNITIINKQYHGKCKHTMQKKRSSMMAFCLAMHSPHWHNPGG